MSWQKKLFGHKRLYSEYELVFVSCHLFHASAIQIVYKSIHTSNYLLQLWQSTLHLVGRLYSFQQLFPSLQLMHPFHSTLMKRHYQIRITLQHYLEVMMAMMQVHPMNPKLSCSSKQAKCGKTNQRRKLPSSQQRFPRQQQSTVWCNE